MAADFLLKPQNSLQLVHAIPMAFSSWLQRRILAFSIIPLAPSIVSRKAPVNYTEEWKLGWRAGAWLRLKCESSRVGCELGFAPREPCMALLPLGRVLPHGLCIHFSPILHHEPWPSPNLPHLRSTTHQPHCTRRAYISLGHVSLSSAVRQRGHQKTSASTETGGPFSSPECGSLARVPNLSPGHRPA